MAVNQRVAIVGAGLIGRSWAIVFAGAGFDVALYDAAAGVADEACALVAEGLDELSAHGLVENAAARVRAARSVADALDGAGYVQENTPETLPGKRAVFGYNFGKLSIAIVDDDKPAAKPSSAVSLASLIKRA